MDHPSLHPLLAGEPAEHTPAFFGYGTMIAGFGQRCKTPGWRQSVRMGFLWAVRLPLREPRRYPPRQAGCQPAWQGAGCEYTWRAGGDHPV